MSIILSNGVTVPDIPSEYFNDYPFVTIFEFNTTVNSTVSKMYAMYMTQAVMGHVEAGVLAGDYSAYELIGSIGAGKIFAFTEGLIDWTVGGQDLGVGEVMLPLYIATDNGGMQRTLLWANHDILEITSLDMTTGAYKTGDIYFWKSGYENVTLPPIPAELKNRYNFYGIIRVTSPVKTYYYLAGSPTFGAYVSPEQLGENYGALYCKSKTGYIAYEYNVGESTDWEFLRNPPYGNGWCNIGVKGAYTYVITNINSDIYYAATFDPVTEDITYSSDVYFAQNIFDEIEKPTRVSIGKNLMDGFADEVQRLTGTTDQMNAIQIREKLSTVKVAIKIGDTVLPPIPDGVLAEYPYVVIMGSVDNGVYVGGMLMASKNRFSFGNKNLVESAYDTILSYGPGAGYEIMAGENEWRFESNVDGIGFPVTKIETMEVLPVWANHDIYIADSFDSVTGELTDSLDLYLSERQNFNGVWLPKIPEDVLKQYPYNVILKISRSGMSVYMLAGLTEELTFAPKEIAATVVECDGILYTKQPCTITSFMYTGAGNWLEQGVSNNDTFKVHVGMPEISYDVFWSNSDVCIATAYDTATNIATIGTDLYFPPLPAIDTDRVSMGYDLCDGIVEEVQRLSGESGQMNALRAYWKLTTVAAVVTVTDDNTNSGIVIDGVSFPDLPEVNFPYAFIAYHTAGYYYLQYSREPYYADYWKTNSTTANPYYKYSSTSVYYDENDGRIFRLPSAGIGVESIWADYTNESSGMALISYNNKNTQVVWSNYDIYFNYPDNTIAFHSSV